MSDVIPEANSEKVDRHVMAAALKTAGNNLKKVSVPPALSNRRSAEEFVRLITDRRARAVENIVAIGQYLREAKEELDHGEFGPMLERIGFSEGTARKYMAIAAHPAISNRSNWNALPPSWTTLYELTKSPPDVIEARIAAARSPLSSRARPSRRSRASRQGLETCTGAATSASLSAKTFVCGPRSRRCAPGSPSWKVEEPRSRTARQHRHPAASSKR
jgi:hypothetical protein